MNQKRFKNGINVIDLLNTSEVFRNFAVTLSDLGFTQ